MSILLKTCVISLLIVLILFLSSCEKIGEDPLLNQSEQTQNIGIVFLGQEAKNILADLPKGQRPLGTGSVILMDFNNIDQLYWFTDVEEKYNIDVPLAEDLIIIYHTSKPSDSYCYMTENEVYAHFKTWMDNTVEGQPIQHLTVPLYEQSYE